MQQWDNSRTFPKNTQCVCPIETERQRSNAEEKRKHTERTHKRASKTQGKGMKGPAHSAFRNLSPFLALPLSLSLALFNVSFYACFLSKAAAKFQCIQLAQWDKQRFACNQTNITSESHEERERKIGRARDKEERKE